MATPDSSGRSATSSVHSAAADALAALMVAGETWPPAASLRFRNLLLDACGSDHRPLIELLLRVGRHGIIDALRALGPVAAADWPTRRTTLVSRACGELFIGAEIAAWAVDAWAVALGTVHRSAAHALQTEYAANATRVQQRVDRVPAPGMMAAGMPPAGTPASRAATTPTATTPTRRTGTPLWAGAPASTRVGAWKRGATGSILNAPRWRVPASSVRAPDLTHFYRVFALAVVLLIGAMLWMRFSPAEPSADVAADSAADSTGESTGESTTASTGESATASVAPSISKPRDPAPVSATAQADASFAPAFDASDVFGADLRHRGIGGTYRVEQRVISVGGNALCDPLADALRRPVVQSIEEFTHSPDSSHFTLASRPGVEGEVQPDGVFVTTPYQGTHNGIKFAFRMSGRFTATGFLARTVTETFAIIKYRQQQRCAVVADLVGVRSVPAPAL